MRARLASGECARVVRDLGTVAREKPFRAAFAVSVLLHLTLFFVVRWEPAAFGGSRGVTMLHLHLIEEAPEPAAPIVAAKAGLPAPVAPARPSFGGRPDHDVAGGQSQATAVAPSTQSVGEPPPASVASAPVETPAAVVAPAAAPARAEQAAAVARVAPVTEPAGDASAGHQVEAPQQVAPAGPAASSPAALQGQVPSAAAAGFVLEGATPAEAARAGGAGAGEPVGAITGVAVGAADVGAVRRRIDERKVYPRVAVRNGWEGRVLVEMRLDGDGSLAAVRLVQGSGHAVLDDATLAAVRRASPFPPVARTITIPVEYRLIP